MALPSTSLGEPEDASPIAWERTGLGNPSGWFWATALGLAALSAAFLIPAALDGPPLARPAEQATLDAPWPWGTLGAGWGLDGLRLLSALCVPAAILATALAARRLLHSEPPALLATGLMALDPALLAVGRAAYPAGIEVALGMGALALFTSVRVPLHWLGSACLTLLAVLDPAALLWSVPLVLLVVLRGHVYAAPTHLVQALGQCLMIPALGAVMALAMRSNGPDLAGCLDLPHAAALSLGRIADLGGGLVAFPDPAPWLAGAATLVAVSGAAFVSVALRFRLQRLPGRLQVRLPGALPALQARGLWLLLLALTVPHPLLAVPLFAMGLAAGIGALGDDSPGFGLALAAAAVAFAVSFLVRAWRLTTGESTPDDVADLLHVLPWSRTVGC